MLTSHMLHNLKFPPSPVITHFKISSSRLLRSFPAAMPWWLSKPWKVSNLGGVTQSVAMIQENCKLHCFGGDFLGSNKWQLEVNLWLILVECIDFALEGLLQAILQVESIGQSLRGQPMKIISAWGRQSVVIISKSAELKPEYKVCASAWFCHIHFWGSVISYKDLYQINRNLTSADLIHIWRWRLQADINMIANTALSYLRAAHAHLLYANHQLISQGRSKNRLGNMSRETLRLDDWIVGMGWDQTLEANGCWWL